MIDPDEQFILDAIVEAWAEEVIDLGGNPESPTPDQDMLLLIRMLERLGPEAVYGKATWEAIKDLTPDEVAEMARSMGSGGITE